MAVSHDLCYSIADIRLLIENRDFYSSALRYFNFLMSIVICLMGLVGNAVVISFTGFILKKNKSKYWFLNLAIADFLVLLPLPFHAISTLKGTWTFGPHMCKLFFFALCADLYASVYILIALNIARVLSVAHPMFHRKFISQRVSFWICSVIWLLTALFSLPMLYYSGELKIGEDILCIYLHTKNFSSVVVDSSYNVSSENATSDISVSDIYTKLHPYIEQCSSETCCGGEETLHLWNYIMFISKQVLIPFVIVGYFIPLGVVIICNIIIVIHVRKSRTVNPHRLYRIVLMIIMLFFITWTPLVMTQTMLLMAFDNMDLITMVNVLTFMPLWMNIAYAHSCLNPIVYVFSAGKMRTGIYDFISSIRNKYK